MGLTFMHGVMSSSKSLNLLAANHNYRENLKATLLFTSALDDRTAVGKISSRLGVSADAIALKSTDDMLQITRDHHKKEHLSAVFVDEVQFLTKEHIYQAAHIADDLGIPVLCYGLKNNVFGELFSEAIHALLALADNIREVKQVCHCGNKATMILRFGADGTVEKSGSVIETGGESRYVSTCRFHWFAEDIGPANRARLNLSSEKSAARPEIIATAH